MKRVIERIIIIIWIILFLFLCTTFLTQCSMMYGNNDLSSDNLHYYTHNIFKTCFASAYSWTADGKYAVLDIPDTCEGYRVTALGGYIGSGGPCPFSVNLPNTLSVYSESTLPDRERDFHNSESASYAAASPPPCISPSAAEAFRFDASANFGTAFDKLETLLC